MSSVKARTSSSNWAHLKAKLSTHNGDKAIAEQKKVDTKRKRSEGDDVPRKKKRTDINDQVAKEYEFSRFKS